MQENSTEKVISARALELLAAAHDGDVALLYLYLLKSGNLDPEQAAAALCRTRQEIGAAEEKLRRMGLLPDPSAPVPSARGGAAPDRRTSLPEPEEELPQYLAADLESRTRSDPTFSALVAEASRVIGRNLNSNDTRILFGIYDYLALPPEVIVILLNYCGEQYAERYGDRRRPSARAIEKLAFEWARQEILTLEQADEYIRRSRERRSELGRIKSALNITGRELTATEAKYVSSWLDMGFREDAAAIAYDRTLTKTGALKWPYIHKIFLSWHEKGLHTAREIEEKDSRRTPGVRKGGEEVRPVDMDELRKIIDRI